MLLILSTACFVMIKAIIPAVATTAARKMIANLLLALFISYSVLFLLFTDISYFPRVIYIGII